MLDRDSEPLATQLVASQGAGARVLQLRIKAGGCGASTREQIQIGVMARRVTQQASALLIVNDRVDIALAVDADGVHLGQTDLPIAAARSLLTNAGRSQMIIGVSTHTLEQAKEANQAGADYIGFGPIFPTVTKESPDPVVGIDRLIEVVSVSKCPVVAIGGISAATAGGVAGTGAHAVCCIGAVNQSADPGAAGRAIASAFQN